jgi:hypothetical protein
MSANFFQTQCQSYTTDTLFGICDNQDGSPAFIDATNQTIWIARVENNSTITVMLIAVDNCITILRNDRSMDSRCDAILIHTDNIIFVELKDERSSWIPHAIEQIETTIINFKANHDISAYRHKRAFAANKKHPNFRSAYLERYQRFYREHGVRLNIEATIKIK